MAKKQAASKPAKTAPESVAITYDLFDLPTAQHKAGLAGLLLQIGSMQQRPLPPEDIPEVVGEVTATSVTIRFTERSVCGLMNDSYDAAIVEASVKTKWPGEPPKREESVEEVDPETKKVKTSKRFIYDVVEPKGHFLKEKFKDGDGVWLKLWRNMLWQVPRSKPTTRGPFKVRAEGKPCGEGPDAWKDLLAVEKARSNPDTGGRPQAGLDELIYRLIRNYVNRKTEEKSGLKWEDISKKKITEDGKERTDVPKEYREKREKVASDAFLALRSRRDQDFVDYFTMSICSVGQFLPSDDFSVVAKALLTQRDDVKTLTLLALSANS